MKKSHAVIMIILSILSLGLAYVIPKLLDKKNKEKKRIETNSKLSEEWEPEIVRKEQNE